MKALVLSAALLLSAGVSFGQVHVKAHGTLVLDKPFKGANTIIITLPDSGVVAWQKATSAFTANGFAVKDSNERLLTVSTELKSAGQSGAMAASAAVEGSKVMLQGTTTSPTPNAPTYIEYRGKKDAATLVAWQQLDALAKAMGGKVEYTRKK